MDPANIVKCHTFGSSEWKNPLENLQTRDPQVSVGLRKSDPAGWGGDSRVWAVSTVVSLRQVDLRPALEEIPPSGAHFWDGCQVIRPLSHPRLCSFHSFQTLRLLWFKDDVWIIIPRTTTEKKLYQKAGRTRTGASWKAARFWGIV